MEFLQIWIGRKPKKSLLECINSVLDKVTDDDTYTLISSTNFLKDNPKVNWISYKTYVDEMLKDESIKNFWDILLRHKSVHEIRSDVIRYHYMSNNTDVLYFDTDVTLHEIFRDELFEKDVAFAPAGNIPYHYDNYIIYGNNKDYFKKLLSSSISLYMGKFSEEEISKYKKIIANPSSEKITQLGGVENYKEWSIHIYNGRYFTDNSCVIENIDFDHLAELKYKKDDE